MEVKRSEIKRKSDEEVGSRSQFAHSHATGLMCNGMTRSQVLRTAVFLVHYLTALAEAQQVNTQMCAGRMDGIVFPDPTNCAGFLRCQSGMAMRQTCRDGTLFDLSLYFCVENNVECGSRPRTIMMPPSRQAHHAVCANARNGVLMVNSANCRAFIECQGGLRLDDECAANELFDARSLTCRAASAVNCGSRKVLPSNLDVAIAEACQGRHNRARVADPRSCDKFFECFFGRTIERSCSLGQLFDSFLESCIHASAARCGSRPTQRQQSMPTNVDMWLSMNLCSDLPSGTRFSDPHDCQGYHECQNRQRFDLICPEGQLFDLLSHQCRPSRFVSCGSRKGMNIVRQNACSGQRNQARIVDPHNCRSYFECQSGQSIERQCELGYLFDAASQQCFEAYRVQCGARIIPSEDALENIEDFFPACPTHGTHYRNNPRDCTGYLVCQDGRMTQQFCPNGLHYNPSKINCDLPQNVNCLAARVVIPQTPILPECYEDDDFFPDLANCQQYYECGDDFEPTLKRCPGGEMWDNSIKSCAPMNPQICIKNFI